MKDILNHDAFLDNMKESYPQPLLNAIEWSCYSMKEIADALDITEDVLLKKIRKEIRWTAKDKRILSQMLHIPVSDLTGYFHK
jgi:hypothetical protein